MTPPLVEVKNLTKTFTTRKHRVDAVKNVSFCIARGEILGLVGESGCGKSTTGRCILRLLEPSSGQIIFDGEEITKKSRRAMKPYRQRMQMIFQDPYASLNPRMTVADIIGEPLDIHRLVKGQKRKDHIAELLEMVGLSSHHMTRYPHEFSGGQRQRIGIARALAVHPEFIVCDEAISALDVSVQAQVVNLLKDLQKKFNLTYLFIAHDLSMVEYLSDRVAVMHHGSIVECAESRKLYRDPQHPYTQSLLQSIPVPDPRVAQPEKFSE